MKVTRVPSKDFQWKVRSNSEKGKYYIVSYGDRWHCTCIGFQTHRKDCRHIRRIKNRLNKVQYEC